MLNIFSSRDYECHKGQSCIGFSACIHTARTKSHKLQVLNKNALNERREFWQSTWFLPEVPPGTDMSVIRTVWNNSGFSNQRASPLRLWIPTWAVIASQTACVGIGSATSWPCHIRHGQRVYLCGWWRLRDESKSNIFLVSLLGRRKEGRTEGKADGRKKVREEGREGENLIKELRKALEVVTFYLLFLWFCI